MNSNLSIKELIGITVITCIALFLLSNPLPKLFSQSPENNYSFNITQATWKYSGGVWLPVIEFTVTNNSIKDSEIYFDMKAELLDGSGQVYTELEKNCMVQHGYPKKEMVIGYKGSVSQYQMLQLKNSNQKWHADILTRIDPSKPYTKSRMVEMTFP